MTATEATAPEEKAAKPAELLLTNKPGSANIVGNYIFSKGCDEDGRRTLSLRELAVAASHRKDLQGPITSEPEDRKDYHLLGSFREAALTHRG